jgi:hypothetical protein
MSKTTKRTRTVGQPTKFRQAFIEEAERVCEQEGFTDKQLAQHFKVGSGTIGNWKRSYPEFAQAVREGKSRFDTDVVENQLLKKIMGGEYEERHYERNSQGRRVLTRVVIKMQDPDTLAMIFWLKNRNPARWGDRKKNDHSGDVKFNIINYADIRTDQALEVPGRPAELPIPVDISKNTD